MKTIFLGSVEQVKGFLAGNIIIYPSYSFRRQSKGLAIVETVFNQEDSELISKGDIIGVKVSKDLAKRLKRNRIARERNQVYKDLGLVKVKGSLGGTYYE